MGRGSANCARGSARLASWWTCKTVDHCTLGKGLVIALGGVLWGELAVTPCSALATPLPAPCSDVSPRVCNSATPVRATGAGSASAAVNAVTRRVGACSPKRACHTF